MKGRTGFIIGVGVGYVLGARAGRERYDQLKTATSSATAKIAEQEQVQTALEATAEPRGKAQEMLGKGLRAASSALRK